MTKVLTGKFDSPEGAHNAHEDFIDTGFPAETLNLNSEESELKVKTSRDDEREVREILARHKPSEITESTM